MPDIPPAMPPPLNGLVTYYARVLAQNGLLDAALSTSEMTANQISPLKRQAGAVYNGTLDANGLSAFAQAHRLQHLIELRNLEVRAAMSHLGVTLPEAVFAGHFPLHNDLSSGRVLRDKANSSGVILLIDGHSLHLLAEAIRLFCDCFVEPAQIDAEQLVGQFSRLLEEHVSEVDLQRTTGHSRVFFAPRRRATEDLIDEGFSAFLAARKGTHDLRNALWPDLVNACLRFVIAHEYGHLFDRQEYGAEIRGEDGEFAADNWAARLLLAHNLASAGPIGRASALFAPTALHLAVATIHAYAIIHGKEKEREAVISLLIRRHQIVTKVLIAQGAWRSDELAMAFEFDNSFRRLVGRSLERIKIARRRPQ